ncbi:MAG TPA: IPT/TIG domain-containing protein [Candidatus Dormibacteraeota bacterium]|nr:IPT/TIG domain-containing protein [Candidatus Dormibacteraeota bacterium]
MTSASLIPPPATSSYYELFPYIAACGSSATTGCALYLQGQSTIPPNQGGVLVLDFGSPCSSGTTYGVQVFESLGCTPNSTIRSLVQKWIQGYESDHGAGTPNFTLAVGTSNSYTGADPASGYQPASLQTSGADWFQQVVGAGYTTGAAPVTVWGASDMEQASDGQWYDGVDTLSWVGGYSAAAFPAVPSTICSLTQSGNLADFGDYNSSGLSAANWTENQVYDVSQGITGTCALPEIYYSGNAPEWEALKVWAQSQGSAAMQFTSVMVEPGGSAQCPPPNGSTLLSASCAWLQLQSDSNQSPSIPGATQIATSLQASGPQVTGVSPNYGPQAGGTTVTIYGSGFLGAQLVYFGTQSVTLAPGQVNSSGTTITVVTPTANPASVDVVVVSGLGSSPTGPADQFQFDAPACTAVTASLQFASVAPGASDLVTASATCPAGALTRYSYFTRPGESGPWALQVAWIGSSWTWSTAGLPDGTYQVLAWASDGPYTVPQAQAAATLTVAPQPACTSVSVTASPNSTTPGGVVGVSASGSCPSGSLPAYSYFTREGSSAPWALQAAWVGPNWAWSTAGLAPGTYQVLVWVSDGPYSVPQAQAAASVQVVAVTPCSAVSATAPASVLVGQTVDVVATSTCPAGSSPLYSYFIRSSSADPWALQAAWIGPNWSWPTAGLAPGAYQVLVWVSDGPFTLPQAAGTATVTLTGLVACSGVTISVPVTATEGLPVAVTAASTCPAGTSPLYTYFTRASGSGPWTLQAAWIGPAWTWSTAGLPDGPYQVLVWVSDGPYTVPQAQAATSLTVYTQLPCTGVTAQASPASLAPDQPVTVSATGTCPSGTSPLYSYFTGPSASGPWTLQAAWIGPSWTWSTTGLADGTYFVLVWVSGAEYIRPQAEALASISVTAVSPCTALSATALPSTVTVGQAVTVTASATCPSGTSPLYTYFTSASPGGPWTLQSAWSGGSWSWPTAGMAAGTYYVLVWTSDGPYTVPQLQVSQSMTVDTAPPCSAVSVSAPASVASGQPVNVLASASCPAGAQVEYSYFLRLGSAGPWTLEAAWIGPQWTWTTVGVAAGNYQVLVWASDGPYTVPQAQAIASVVVTG